MKSRPDSSRSALIPARPWQRLQFRLTLSFGLVTMLAVLLIMIALNSILIHKLVFSSGFPDEIAHEMMKAAEPTTQFFHGDRVDVMGMTRWLDQQRFEDPFPNPSLATSTPTPSHAHFVIAHPNGIVITSSPDSTLFPPGKSLFEICKPQEVRLLEEARGGTPQAARDGKRIICAGQIKDNGKVIALGFVRTRESFSFENAVRSVGLSTLSIALVTSVGGMIVGGFAGLIVVRSLNRRLNGIVNAADRWASGDLKAVAPSNRTDEFGLLGSCLNQMAADLDQVMSLRRQVAALEERQKLTRDLHDTVKQQAFATSMMVASARERLESGDIDGAKGSLEHLESLARRMQLDLGEILREMRSRAGEHALKPSILRLAHEWSERSGMQVEADISVDASRLSGVMADEILGILQEALANAARHSEGTVVRIGLCQLADTWRLMIEDNGKGISPDQLYRGGLGMQTMRERTRQLPDGAFQLDNQATGGVRIEVRFKERGSKWSE